MVVFMKNYEMEDDGRRTKRVGLFRRMFGGSSWSPTSSYRQSTTSLGPTTPPRERRPLRSVPTVGSQHKVDPEVLTKEYVEKEVKYIGTVTDTKHDFNPGDRTVLLSLLDEKKSTGQLPSHLTWKHDVIISFSVYNIKVLWRDEEQLIHRIPTHCIASTGYVKDDNQVFLFIKFASEVNEKMCNLAFFSCDTKELAEEICCLNRQLFQLVYTDSTMDFFDKSIQDGAITPKNHSYSTDDSDKKEVDTIKLALPLKPDKTLIQQSGEPVVVQGISNGLTVTSTSNEVTNNYAARSATLPLHSASSSIHSQKMSLLRSSSNAGVATSPLSSSSTPSSPVNGRKQKISGNGNASAANVTHQLQLKEYIAVLKERLLQEELTQFAQHLHYFRKGSTSIEVFCEQLLTIYTEQRKSLLLGMRHFIPQPRDRAYFEVFLQQHNVVAPQDADSWWDHSLPDSQVVSEAEDSSVSSAPHPNEISSNFDLVSVSTTSENNSGEWDSVMTQTIEGLDEIQLDDEDEESPSTVRRRSPRQFGFPEDASPPEEIPRSSSISTTPLAGSPVLLDVPNVLLGADEEGDSHLLHSGENRESVTTTIILPRVRRESEKKYKKKKSRGKSPSAVELAAPYPSLATVGTDEDLDSSHDMPLKTTNSKKQKRKKNNPRDDSKDRNISNKPQLPVTQGESGQMTSFTVLAMSAQSPDSDLDVSKDFSTIPVADSTFLQRRETDQRKKKKKHKSSTYNDKKNVTSS